MHSRIQFFCHNLCENFIIRRVKNFFGTHICFWNLNLFWSFLFDESNKYFNGWNQPSEHSQLLRNGYVIFLLKCHLYKCNSNRIITHRILLCYCSFYMGNIFTLMLRKHYVEITQQLWVFTGKFCFIQPKPFVYSTKWFGWIQFFSEYPAFLYTFIKSLPVYKITEQNNVLNIKNYSKIDRFSHMEI